MQTENVVFVHRSQYETEEMNDIWRVLQTAAKSYSFLLKKEKSSFYNGIKTHNPTIKYHDENKTHINKSKNPKTYSQRHSSKKWSRKIVPQTIHKSDQIDGNVRATDVSKAQIKDENQNMTSSSDPVNSTLITPVSRQDKNIITESDPATPKSIEDKSKQDIMQNIRFLRVSKRHQKFIFYFEKEGKEIQLKLEEIPKELEESVKKYVLATHPVWGPQIYGLGKASMITPMVSDTTEKDTEEFDEVEEVLRRAEEIETVKQRSLVEQSKPDTKIGEGSSTELGHLRFKLVNMAKDQKHNVQVTYLLEGKSKEVELKDLEVELLPYLLTEIAKDAWKWKDFIELVRREHLKRSRKK